MSLTTISSSTYVAFETAQWLGPVMGYNIDGLDLTRIVEQGNTREYTFTILHMANVERMRSSLTITMKLNQEWQEWVIQSAERKSRFGDQFISFRAGIHPNCELTLRGQIRLIKQIVAKAISDADPKASEVVDWETFRMQLNKEGSGQHWAIVDTFAKREWNSNSGHVIVKIAQTEDGFAAQSVHVNDFWLHS